MILADSNKDAKARFQIPYESVSRARDPSTARGELAQDFLFAHQLTPSGAWSPGWG